jgi:hypothetical protein
MEDIREVGRESEMRSATRVLWMERRVVWNVVYGGLEVGARERKYAERARVWVLGRKARPEKLLDAMLPAS